MSFGSVTSVCVCDPRQVCTAATCFGLRRSLMSKMRMPRKRSALTGACTPCVPQSSRPRVCSTDMNSRLPCTDTSPCPPGHTTDASSCGFARILDVVGVEPVEVADEEMVALEREVGVREVQRRSTRLRRRPASGPRRQAPVLTRPVVGSAPVAGARTLRRRRARRRAPSDRRSPPASTRRDQLHVARGVARILEARLESDARIGPGCGDEARSCARPWIAAVISTADAQSAQPRILRRLPLGRWVVASGVMAGLVIEKQVAGVRADQDGEGSTGP